MQPLAADVFETHEKRPAQAVGNALCGLQSLCDSPEARGMVAALIPKVEACRTALDGAAIEHALHGLKSLRDSPEVRALLYFSNF